VNMRRDNVALILSSNCHIQYCKAQLWVIVSEFVNYRKTTYSPLVLYGELYLTFLVIWSRPVHGPKFLGPTRPQFF